MSCFYCEKDERLLALMTPLAGMTWSDVYLFNDQKHRGRCIVAFREHHDEIFQLSDAQRDGFFAEVAAVAEAVSHYTGADKINYAIYGDNVSHFHVHLVPKIRDGLQWGGPFTDSVPTVTLSSLDFQETGRALLAALDAAAAQRGLPTAEHRLA